MQRIAEPELMDSPAQVAAYASADFAESNAAFVDRLLASLDMQQPENGQQEPEMDRGRLIDLGCGPGDICRRLARALPRWQIEGLDAGANMLAAAERATASGPEAERVSYRLARLPDPSLPRGVYQIVVSNSLLHHLPDPMALWNAVGGLAAPGALVQVMDLARPASETRARSLVDQYAAAESEVLREDFFNSLRAAWTVDEVAAQLAQANLGLAVEMVSDRHWLVHGRMRREPS